MFWKKIFLLVMLNEIKIHSWGLSEESLSQIFFSLKTLRTPAAQCLIIDELK